MAGGSPDASCVSGAVLPEVLTGVYRHFKGQHYLVLGLAHSAHNDEVYVVYVPLYAHPGAPMAIREVSDFLSTIQLNRATVPRFQYCGQEVSGD